METAETAAPNRFDRILYNLGQGWYTPPRTDLNPAGLIIGTAALGGAIGTGALIHEVGFPEHEAYQEATSRINSYTAQKAQLEDAQAILIANDVRIEGGPNSINSKIQEHTAQIAAARKDLPEGYNKTFDDVSGLMGGLAAGFVIGLLGVRRVGIAYRRMRSTRTTAST